jgi:hypothetical protein
MNLRRWITQASLALLLLLLGLAPERGYGRRHGHPYYRAMASSRGMADVLREIGPRHRPALQSAARQAGVPYPPPRLTLLGIKDERRLEVWTEKGTGFALLRSLPVLAASGGAGPKLAEGDMQVPEGLYRLTHFNPNSSYHLSVRVDYPNEYDRARAREDGRTRLGGDIYIHGKAVSIGCLALGDAGIEELFTLLSDTGLARVCVVLVPDRRLVPGPGAPGWTRDLYRQLAAAVAELGPGESAGEGGR